MPELPEVETCAVALRSCILQRPIEQVKIYHTQLRLPITETITTKLPHQKIVAIQRRGKYLLFILSSQLALLIHLGMSGKLSCLPSNEPLKKHDHFEIKFNNNLSLRYNDTRRFGVILLIEPPFEHHPLIASLGVEPLTDDFNIAYLHPILSKSSQLIKTAIMNHKIVTGVGNIYANEALFQAGINPLRIANTLNKKEIEKLIISIKNVLKSAIEQGGTTIRDFASADGNLGYFQQQLNVYGRANKPCYQCSNNLTAIRINNRATVYCTLCQNSKVMV